MSNARPRRPPADRKTKLEDEIVERAREPFRGLLDPDEREGMRIFLDLFVKTHPAMQRMIARRLTEERAPEGGAPEGGESTPPAPSRPAPERSTIVSRDPAVPAGDTAEGAPLDGSGIVAKGERRGGAGEKAGGDR